MMELSEKEQELLEKTRTFREYREAEKIEKERREAEVVRLMEVVQAGEDIYMTQNSSRLTAQKLKLINLAQQRMTIYPEKMEQQVFRLIRRAFEHQMRGATVVLFDPQVDIPKMRHKNQYGKTLPKIVCGRFGFGLRYNVQAKAVYSMEDFRYICSQKELIVERLKEKKLDGEAATFEELMKILPDPGIFIEGGLSIPIAKSVEITDSFGYLGKVLSFEFMANSYQAMSLTYERKRGSDKEIYSMPIDVLATYRKRYEYCAYKMVDDQMDSVIDLAQQELNNLKGLVQGEMIERINGVLGKWLLLSGL